MKLLFFAPHSALWVHAFPEALIAETLMQRGHEIVYMTCGQALRAHCTPMTAAGVGPSADAAAKARVCADCGSAEGVLRRRFGLRGPDLASTLSSDDRAQADAVVGAVTRETLLDTALHGVSVGRYAVYEFLLTRKKGRLAFDDVEWDEVRTALRHACLALLAAKRVIDAESPQRVVVYNSLYSVNHVVCRYAESRGIPAYFLHAGGNLSRRLETLLIGRGDGVRFYDDLLAWWPRVRDVPCGARHLAPVTDHLLELLRGRNVFVYSAARTADVSRVRDMLKLAADRPVLVATMSSPDERFAAETIGVMRPGNGRVFTDQTAWIDALCAWAHTRPDLQLVVRVHPREFPNKRETVLSENAQRLRALLDGLPGNVVVNWPEDGVSLYDLAEVADVFLNAWSAAGKEMAVLGLPVVVWAPELLVYPPDLNIVATSRDDYFARIDKALADGWQADRVRRAYRWYAFEYERCVFDLASSFPQSNLHRGSVRHQVDRVLNRVSPWLKRQADCLRRRALPDGEAIERVLVGGAATRLDFLDPDACRAGPDEENRALAAEVRRLVDGLFGPASAGTSPVLRRYLEALAH
jgi:hypothetical protein